VTHRPIAKSSAEPEQRIIGSSLLIWGSDRRVPDERNPNDRHQVRPCRPDDSYRGGGTTLALTRGRDGPRDDAWPGAGPLRPTPSPGVRVHADGVRRHQVDSPSANTLDELSPTLSPLTRSSSTVRRSRTGSCKTPTPARHATSPTSLPARGREQSWTKARIVLPVRPSIRCRQQMARTRGAVARECRWICSRW